MTNPKITIGTVCFLFDNKNQVLLLKRAFEPMKNMLTGVGGKTHFNEDVHESCIREIKEETGLVATNLKLKGVVKTILQGENSSWILFIYTTNEFTGELIKCPEGELYWVDKAEVPNTDLIGFIKELIPFVFNINKMIEGTITHDLKGAVLEKKITVVK